MPEYDPMTSDQIRSAKIQEAEFLKMGAEIDSDGKLKITEEQFTREKGKMEANIFARKLKDLLSPVEITLIEHALCNYKIDGGRERDGGNKEQTEANELGKRIINAMNTLNE